MYFISINLDNNDENLKNFKHILKNIDEYMIKNKNVIFKDIKLINTFNYSPLIKEYNDYEQRYPYFCI